MNEENKEKDYPVVPDVILDCEQFFQFRYTLSNGKLECDVTFNPDGIVTPMFSRNGVRNGYLNKTYDISCWYEPRCKSILGGLITWDNHLELVHSDNNIKDAMKDFKTIASKLYIDLYESIEEDRKIAEGKLALEKIKYNQKRKELSDTLESKLGLSFDDIQFILNDKGPKEILN